MANKNAYLLLILCFLLLVAFSKADEADDSLEDCLYTIRVKTGSKDNAGTDSKVGIRIGNKKNDRIDIPSLRKWGTMPPGHNYFEKGNLDSFSYQGKCLTAPICYLRVNHDNSGKKPGWYLSYVEVGIVGTKTFKRWTINQWLALSEPPYSLSVTKDDCPVKTFGDDVHLEMAIDG